ncbi:MAG: hypothetical protein H7Y39_01710 [Nitrospiraceae bacterium]|nr:hypothetical protein [Nitrospiraceae bacterium]
MPTTPLPVRPVPNDLPRIVAGVGGTPVAGIPFLQQQTRFTFANFGITEPLALDA